MTPERKSRRSKRRITRSSRVAKRNLNGVGGKPLSRGSIYWMLKKQSVA